MSLISKLTSLKSNSARTLYEKGRELSRSGCRAEAIGIFDQALAIDDCHGDALYEKGLCLMKLNQFNDAVACFDRISAIKPSFEASFQKGATLVYLGKINEALVCFDQAIEINPQSAEAWENKAVCCKLIGKNDTSVRCLETAHKIRGDYKKKDFYVMTR
jgi:tetratricopeptide (TPR) repeat protein